MYLYFSACGVRQFFRICRMTNFFHTFTVFMIIVIQLFMSELVDYFFNPIFARIYQLPLKLLEFLFKLNCNNTAHAETDCSHDYRNRKQTISSWLNHMRPQNRVQDSSWVIRDYMCSSSAPIQYVHSQLLIRQVILEACVIFSSFFDASKLWVRQIW